MVRGVGFELELLTAEYYPEGYVGDDNDECRVGIVSRYEGLFTV